MKKSTSKATAKTFRDIFGMSKPELYNYIRNGKYKALRIGKSYIRLTDTDIKRYLDSFRLNA